MNTEQIEAALKLKYPSPEYAFLLQVRNQTGYSGQIRTADAIAMSLWPSRGITLEGIEIKAFRSDWVRELENPAKAESFAQYCDHWWLAVGDADIVKDGELPKNWGLLVPRAGKMVVKTNAPDLEPSPLPKKLLAGILRNASERYAGMMPAAESGRIRTEAYTEAMTDHKRITAPQLQDLNRRLSGLERILSEFRMATGISLHEYNAKKIGETIRWLEINGAAVELAKLRQIADTADNIGGYLREKLKQLEAELPNTTK